MFNDFDAWEDGHFLFTMIYRYGNALTGSHTSALGAEIGLEKRSDNLRTDVEEAKVISNKLLTAPSEPEKRSIEIQLPKGSTYRAGDYLAALPLNPEEAVRPDMKRCQLPSVGYVVQAKVDGKDVDLLFDRSRAIYTKYAAQ